jgi:hypothetical protein
MPLFSSILRNVQYIKNPRRGYNLAFTIIDRYIHKKNMSGHEFTNNKDSP